MNARKLRPKEVGAIFFKDIMLIQIMKKLNIGGWGKNIKESMGN